MLYENEIKEMTAIYETMEYRLSDKLSDPKKLIEICDEGIRNPVVATNCIAELLEQLKHSDKVHSMICIDDYNYWLMPTGFPSFRYMNNKQLNGFIPPYDMALARLFVRFDGHFSRNGVKMLATSHHTQHNHMASPNELQFYEGYHQ
jgi:hypothetical protein